MRIFNVVVFPAPFGPKKPKISPRATDSESPFSATSGGRPGHPDAYDLVRSSITMSFTEHSSYGTVGKVTDVGFAQG